MRETCQHYETIAVHLGIGFRRNVEAKLQGIAERPESFGRIGGNFRGALIDRFPYVVVFAVEGGIPHIYGVRHAASDQDSWFEREFSETS